MTVDNFKFRIWAGDRWRWRSVTVRRNARGSDATLDDALRVLYRRYPDARVTGVHIAYGRSTR